MSVVFFILAILSLILAVFLCEKDKWYWARMCSLLFLLLLWISIISFLVRMVIV